MRYIYYVTFTILCFVLSFIGIITHQESLRLNEQEEFANNRSGALEALDFWTRARAYPDADIPANKYFKAYMSSKLKSKEVSRTISSGSIWDPIGPLNLHGRTLCVAINPTNPNTVYIGTASGGLWRSFTGGLGGDWQQVKLGYPALGISSIIISPIDTNIMYIGTGEVYRYQTALGGLVIRTTRGSYGIGILKTINGGNTWTKSLDWIYNQQRGIEKLAFNPLNPNTIWAATTEGVFLSTNAGSSWSESIGLNTFGITMANEIIVHPTDTNKVIFTSGNFTPSMVWYSTNSGTDWNISPMPIHSGKILLALYPPNPDLVYASAADSTTGKADFYKSTNFGISWVLLKSFTGTGGLYGVQGWYSHYVAVHPQDSTKIILNAVGRAKSTDGGSTFLSVGSGYSDNHGYAIHPTNPNIVYAVNDDGVYRSTDFGSSYTNIGFGLQTGQIYNGFSCSTSDSMIALAQSQDHIPGYRYLGSNVWDHGSANDEAGWTAIDPSNDNIMYAINRYGGAIYKSYDRGETFSGVAGFGSVGAWNSPIVICPANTNVLYFGDTRIFYSATGGNNWTQTNSGSPLDGNPTLSMAISSTSPETVYVGTAPIATSAHIFRTTNYGNTWTNVTGSLPNRYPIDMAVDPTDSRIVYVAYGGFSGGHLFKSTNAGSTWSDISGSLPDVPTTAVCIDPLHPNVVYAGNDIGVYVSTSGGGSWSSFNAGLPDAVIVADLTLSPSNRTIRVATHGNGVWERKMLFELPLNYFDYKAASLDYPINNTQVEFGTIFSSIRASIKNLSAEAQTNSFDVKYRILSGTNEVYSNTKHTTGLGLTELRQITFDDSFTPSDTGYYTIELILLATDQNSSNDTLSGKLLVVSPPTISNFVATKIYSPYLEITGGLSGPWGDDAQSIIPLPFNFRYDNYTYDSAQISTNGWIELGTGGRGYLRGLSTPNQLGGYFQQVLASANRPTKVLAPWCGDLSASQNQISYTTLGSAPNRIFVVQWKNVLAYYNSSTTTMLINFQIKLYETSNLIDFCYGPVVAGTFPSDATGASTGLKDYIGGDYRYYDLARFSSGLVGDLRLDLTPLVNWPGTDSCYHIMSNPTGLFISYPTGWNMISNMHNQTDNSVHTIFLGYNSNTFKYANGYVFADSLKPGSGYWLKFPASTSLFVSGNTVSTIDIPLQAGWNMIGSVDHEVSAPSGGIISSSIFEYTGSGYTEAVTLVPGRGYWVRANTSGTITLGSQNLPRSASKIPDANCSMIISDKLGRKQTLYLTENQFNPDLYELPPVPPLELFDVRFATQRTVESLPKDSKESSVYIIQMQSPVFPLTVSYKIQNAVGKEYYIEEISNGKIIQAHNLSGEGGIIITNTSGINLQLRVTSGKQMPTHYALTQNYPNPFNPTTTISFDVPVKSNVRLSVYDLLGKEIMTIANGEYDAGIHTIHVDFSNLSSGMYLYRLKAGNFTDVKKMIMTK